MDSNVVLVLANAEDEADEVVAVASGDHFRSSILLAAEVADADAVAAGRPAVMIISVFGAVQGCRACRHMVWQRNPNVGWFIAFIQLREVLEYNHQSCRA